MKRVKALERLWQDTRHSLRALKRERLFAATAILTLAVAIAGNTAVFTVVYSLLLKPLPYPASDELVRISGGATPSRFAEMQSAAQSFTAIAAFSPEENMTLSGNFEPEVLKSVRVSHNFLRILGVSPLHGRAFRSEEDSANGPPVVMISAGLWQRRFLADPDIAGKIATLAGTPYTIIGVLPTGFHFPFQDIDLWMTAPSESPLFASKSRALSPFLSIFGRLKPGVSIEKATAEAKVLHRQYAIAHPAMLDAKPKMPVRVIAMKDDLVTDVRSMLWMLLGAVAFVLFIACANVAGLLLARAASRSREMALRAALGAARIRLIAQMIAESVILSLSAGVLGILLAVWAVRLIPAMTAFELPRVHEVRLDWIVLGFALVLSTATGMLFGLAPALEATRVDFMRLLRTPGETTLHRGAKSILPGLTIRSFLLMAQVALCIVLLIGTALLIQSVSRLRGVSIGFNPEHLLTAAVSLSPSRYSTTQKRVLFFWELLQRLESTPGIRDASAAMFLPMMGFAGTPVQDASKPLPKLNERPIMTISIVTPGYFRTLEIPFRRGRNFTERDKDGPRVAIIDEGLARHFWPAYPRGLDPVGQHLWVGGVDPHPAEIVGIVAGVHQNLENTGWPGTVYVSFAQNPQPFAVLAIRTEGNPMSFSSALREQMRAVDKDQPVSAIQTMDDLIEREIGQRRLLSILLGSFASMAVVLVLMGIYGIVAYSVAQRTRELGIRRALGAQQGDILWLAVGQSLRLAFVGIVAGLAGSLFLTRLIRSMLFHVSATDPAILTRVALLFLGVVLVASYIPARRATRIDPVAAIRA